MTIVRVQHRSRRCDKELTTTNQTIDEKTTKKEELQTSIDSLTAQIASLEADIKKNTVDISEMESAIATAVEDRQAESAENKATIKDAQDAQNAVSNAELKGSIGEGPNHSNHSNHSNSFKIGIFPRIKFKNLRRTNEESFEEKRPKRPSHENAETSGA